MAKNCLTILKNTSPELHDYLRGKAAMDYDESPASKQAYIQAAQDLQNETLNNLNDIYADLKIGDYKKIAAPEKVPEPPVSSVEGGEVGKNKGSVVGDNPALKDVEVKDGKIIVDNNKDFSEGYPYLSGNKVTEYGDAKTKTPAQKIEWALWRRKLIQDDLYKLRGTEVKNKGVKWANDAAQGAKSREVRELLEARKAIDDYISKQLPNSYDTKLEAFPTYTVSEKTKLAEEGILPKYAIEKWGATEQSQPKGVSPSSKGSVEGGEVPTKINGIKHDTDSNTTLLPIEADVEKVLPDAESFTKDGFVPKKEFHITAVGFKTGKEIKALLKNATPEQIKAYNDLIASTEWSYTPKNEFYHIEKQYGEEKRESIIQMVDVPAMKDFYENLNKIFGTNYAPAPAHVTLMTKGNAMGIGINSQADFESLNPKRIETTTEVVAAKPKIRVSAEQVEQGQPQKSELVKKLSASLSERLSSIQPKVQENETKAKPTPDNAAQRPASTKAATGSEVSSQTPAQKTRARTKGTRKANRKIKSPVYKKALEVEANRPHDMVMQYFIGGGNIHPSALQEIFGAKGKGKNISKTKQSYIGLLNKDASTIKELAHSFWEDLPEDSPYTDRDFVNAINEVLGSFNSRTQMAEDINKRYNQTLNEDENTYEQFLEQQRGPIPEEIVQEAVAIVEEMSADEINSLLQADADQQAGIIDEQSEGFTLSEADISKSAQAENRLKQAKSNYDKAARQLNAAEEKISNKQTTQGSLLRSEGTQGQMFGLDRDEAKSILDPLRQKVRETKAELDAAQKEFIAATDQQLNLFDISNSSLQDGDTKTIGDYVTAAKSVLENLYPNAKLEVYNTTEEYEKAGGPKATRGFAIMGKEGNHRILLNLERISEDKSGKTAIHEVIHPIVYDAFGIDSDKLNEAWKDMAIVMKDVPGMELVFAHVRNYAASKAAPEGITELLTQIVTGNINIENVPKEKKSKILEILNKILEFFGIDFRFGSAQDFATLAQKIKQSFDTSNPESLREVIKQKGIDKFIQEYERLSEKDISPQSRDEILNDFVKEQIAAGESLDDIKEALVDNGLSEDQADRLIDRNTKPKVRVVVGKPSGVDVIEDYEMTTSGLVNEFLSKGTIEEALGETPQGDQTYEVQTLTDMLQDGLNMIKLAMNRWGTDIMDYGIELFQYVQAMSNDANLTNKKAVLLATFLGELKESMLREPSRRGEIQPLYNAVEEYYQRYMNIRGKEVVAGRLLRLYRDKYIGDLFGQRILDERLARVRRSILDAEQSQKIDDAIAEYQKTITKKEKEDQGKAAKNRKQTDKTKQSNKNKLSASDAKQKADAKLEEIKNQAGGNAALIDKIKEAIKKINCK